MVELKERIRELEGQQGNGRNAAAPYNDHAMADDSGKEKV